VMEIFCVLTRMLVMGVQLILITCKVNICEFDNQDLPEIPKLIHIKHFHVFPYYNQVSYSWSVQCYDAFLWYLLFVLLLFCLKC
jgi:hypothetical protein